MFKLILLSMCIAMASAGLAPLGGAVNYGYNIGGGGAYGGYGAGSVKVFQSPLAYNYAINTQAVGGNGYINQGASYGGYGGYGAGNIGLAAGNIGLAAGNLGFGAGYGGLADYGNLGLGGYGAANLGLAAGGFTTGAYGKK